MTDIFITVMSHTYIGLRCQQHKPGIPGSDKLYIELSIYLKIINFNNGLKFLCLNVQVNHFH